MRGWVDKRETEREGDRQMNTEVDRRGKTGTDIRTEKEKLDRKKSRRKDR